MSRTGKTWNTNTVQISSSERRMQAISYPMWVQAEEITDYQRGQTRGVTFNLADLVSYKEVRDNSRGYRRTLVVLRDGREHEITTPYEAFTTIVRNAIELAGGQMIGAVK